MSLFHVCIYKFDRMLHVLPKAHTNRGLQSTMQVLGHFCVTGNCYICYLRLTRTEVFNPQCKYWVIFVSQGTSFYECKIDGIIQKVVSLLSLNKTGIKI